MRLRASKGLAVNLKWSRYLNANCETINLLEEKVDKRDCELSKEVLDMRGEEKFVFYLLKVSGCTYKLK